MNDERVKIEDVIEVIKGVAVKYAIDDEKGRKIIKLCLDAVKELEPQDQND